MRRTSSRRSIRWHPSENGRCSKIIENSKIGVSRHLDSSTTTQMAKIMVQYGRSSRSSWTKSVWSSFGRTIMGKAIWESAIETWMGEGFQLGMLIRTPWNRVILICVCGWHQIGWKETKHWSDVESTQQRSWFGRTNIFPGSCVPGMYSTTMRNKQRYCGQLQNHVWIENFRGENWKITIPSKSWYFFMVLRKGRSCQEMCGTILWAIKQDDSTTLQSIHSMHRWPPLQRRRNEICWRIVTCMLSNCSEMLFLGTYWKTWYSLVSEQTCTISYIHHTRRCRQYCHVGNTAKQCRLGLFQDSDFAGDLEDSKSTSSGTWCIFGSHTFVPKSLMCKKQTSVSHSSTESEIISLDAGLRLDGIPALDLWELIVAVLHGNTYQSNQERWDPCTNLVRAAPHKLPTRNKSHGMIDDLDNVDFIHSNVHSARQEALLYIFEDNEAVIKMIIFGRSPTMRHVSRTHRVALDWLFDRINFGPQDPNQIHWHQKPTRRHTDNGKFHTWWVEHLLCLFNISHFSSTACLEVMSKRTQEVAGEERVTANSSRWWIWSRDTKRACLDCIRKPGENQIWKSNTSELVEWAATKNGETCDGR